MLFRVLKIWKMLILFLKVCLIKWLIVLLGSDEYVILLVLWRSIWKGMLGISFFIFLRWF